LIPTTIAEVATLFHSNCLLNPKLQTRIRQRSDEKHVLAHLMEVQRAVDEYREKNHVQKHGMSHLLEVR
jgi:Ser-tRNA(Ala) deacylase AlaX